MGGLGCFKSNMCVLEFVFSFVLELVAFLRSFVSGTGVLRGVKLVHIAWTSIPCSDDYACAVNKERKKERKKVGLRDCDPGRETEMHMQQRVK